MRPVSHSMNVGNPGGPYKTFTPWREQRGELCHSIIDRGGYPIGIACERPDQKSNAHLMSAAPDLLAALEALCAWSDHSALTGQPDGAPVADSAPSFDETVNMVHAAIKKARGA